VLGGATYSGYLSVALARLDERSQAKSMLERAAIGGREAERFLACCRVAVQVATGALSSGEAKWPGAETGVANEDVHLVQAVVESWGRLPAK